MQHVSSETIELQINRYESDPDKFMNDLPGLGMPKQYWFVSPYRTASGIYPTKPLVAAALEWPDVNGGFSTPDSACNVLERAGYVITDRAGEPITPAGDPKSLSAALIDWNANPGTTETLAWTRQRIGQNLFRLALMKKWKGRCVITGITDESLLRASHIRAWSACETDADRLNPNNGLLLSALWDAAFDAGQISFGDDGKVLISGTLSENAKSALGLADFDEPWFGDEHAPWLAWHRAHHGFE